MSVDYQISLIRAGNDVKQAKSKCNDLMIGYIFQVVVDVLALLLAVLSFLFLDLIGIFLGIVFLIVVLFLTLSISVSADDLIQSRRELDSAAAELEVAQYNYAQYLLQN